MVERAYLAAMNTYNVVPGGVGSVGEARAYSRLLQSRRGLATWPFARTCVVCTEGGGPARPGGAAGQVESQ